jgi:hypothetical protein
MRFMLERRMWRDEAVPLLFYDAFWNEGELMAVAPATRRLSRGQLAREHLSPKFEWIQSLLHHPPRCVIPQHWSRKKQRINAVQHAAMPRQDCSRVFHSCPPLNEGFHQVSELRCDV